MNYCVNPACGYPENPARAKVCHFCESTLLLRDRYRVTKALGQGGFGATFLATDLTLPNKPNCVLKQLRPTLHTPSFLEMAQVLFEREALTLKKIGNHSQIPQLLDYFEESQRFYLVLEYIPGLTIQQKIKQGGVFKEVQVKQFLNKMLPLLEYIHSQQVIHRDIKPANIIYRQSDQQWILIDFGSVKDKIIHPRTDSSSGQTALTAYSVGTPGYAPPEQIAMRPVYASDIYALGATCIYLFTGKSAIDFRNYSSTGERIWYQDLVISEAFTKIIQKMMANSMRDRYHSATEVMQALSVIPDADISTPAKNNSSSKPLWKNILPNGKRHFWN
ncbi:MAG: serine/threonine-protein kinase [Crinalium sp.]